MSTHTSRARTSAALDTPDRSAPMLRRQFAGTGVAAAALLLAACSKTAAPARKPLPKESTLLCLGDSLTFGFGAPAESSYPQKLEQLTGYVTQNAGVNGDTAEGALERLPALLLAAKPGLVLVSIGANDFLRGLPLAGTTAALKAIVRLATASAQVVLIAQPRPDLLAYSAGSLADHPVYAEVAAETGVPLYAGGWSAVLSRPGMRSDQIHANSSGYEAFAEQLAAWLRKQKFLQ